ncbi:hypothetical protein [Nannocystis pusilla]|uniref:hypothetical protein n=1 Tax=Nannocystis pusilla TaxID=889268 RepID=UPI003DA4A991
MDLHGGDALAFAPPPADQVAPTADMGDDGEEDEVSRLMAIEATIIGGIMSLLSAAFLLWVRADRKRTDATMKADRERAEQRTDQLVATLREQNDLLRKSHDATLSTMRAADEANRQGLADLARSVGNTTQEIHKVREDMDRGFDRLDGDIRNLDKRMTRVENTGPSAGASMTHGRG